MKLEVVVIPVADADRVEGVLHGGSGGGSTPTSRSTTASASSSSRRPARPPRSSSARRSPRPRPGSARGLYLIVSDIEAARDELAGRGVEISEVFHPGAPGAQFARDGADRVSGPAPEHATYGSFATFSDPDGNEWLLQEVTQRLPGRIDAAETAFASTADLADAMRRASVAHGEHEKRDGRRVRRELARLVRRLHGGRAGRDGAADMNADTATREELP